MSVSNTRWTRELIAVCILTFWKDYGRPPSVVDWDPAAARRIGHHERAELFERSNWPSAATVRRVFGSWSRAIEDVGFDIPTRGRPRGLTEQASADRGYKPAEKYRAAT